MNTTSCDARTQFMKSRGLFLVHDDGTVTNLYLVPDSCFTGPPSVVGSTVRLSPGVYITVPDKHADDQRRAVAVLVAGQPYSACRSEIEALDWGGWYPEVDVQGYLTGEIIEANSTDHDGWTMVRTAKDNA